MLLEALAWARQQGASSATAILLAHALDDELQPMLLLDLAFRAEFEIGLALDGQELAACREAFFEAVADEIANRRFEIAAFSRGVTPTPQGSA